MKHFYRDLGFRIPESSFVFLNYGFFDGRPTSRVGGADRHHVELLRRVLGASDLGHSILLEIGCGRGGNCVHLATTAGADRVVGIDLSLENVRFCSRTHFRKNLVFLGASAESIPFRSATFDLVLNLESAHCYGDFDSFLREVDRVLKPGGGFCFADLWGLEAFPLDWNRRERALGNCGWELLHHEDISRQVLAALQQKDSITGRLQKLSNRHNRHFIERIIRGNRVVEAALANGDCRYRLWRFRKPY